MSVFNYLNVDSAEFEEIGAEILSILLGKKFRTYKEGPDGGVDIKQEAGDNSIIGQAKRYKNPSAINFDEEFEKIEKIGCIKYYIFIATELSPSKSSSIYKKFSKYMDDETNIYDAKRLDELLVRDEYKTVVEKHFRLWATSPKIIELLKTNKINFDSSVLVSKIEEHQKYYVETKDSKLIFDKLLDKRAILVTGDAGVGKSTISEIAIIRFLKKYPSANVVYSSCSNIESIKDSLSRSPEQKEIIYIDDFLGEFALAVSKKEINSVTTLITGIISSPNKYIIINSRAVILNAAKNESVEFEKSLEKIGVYRIQINKLSFNEKAKILYNLLYFSEIPADAKKEFLSKKSYFDVVRHPNYNPRLIERICSNNTYIISGKDNFITYINDILLHQEASWEDTYNKNLNEEDRLLLLVMSSLTFNSDLVLTSVLQKAFNHELNKHSEIDTTRNVFKISLEKMNDVFVNTYLISDIQAVKYNNPSAKECIYNHTFVNQNDLLYFEQYLYFDKDFIMSDTFSKMINDKTINELKFVSINLEVIYGLYFYHFKNSDPSLKQEFISSICHSFSSPYEKTLGVFNRDIFRSLHSNPLFKTIDLNSIDDTKLVVLINNCVVCLNECDVVDVLRNLNEIKIEVIRDSECIKETLIREMSEDVNFEGVFISHFCDDGADYNIDLAKADAIEKVHSALSDNYIYSFLSNDDCYEIDDFDIQQYMPYDFDDRLDEMSDDYDYEEYMEKREPEEKNIDLDKLFSNLLR